MAQKRRIQSGEKMIQPRPGSPLLDFTAQCSATATSRTRKPGKSSANVHRKVISAKMEKLFYEIKMRQQMHNKELIKGKNQIDFIKDFFLHEIES